MSENIQPRLYSVEETIQAIESGSVLWLAGDEKLLEKLPKGRWVGATIPYFMSAEEGGVTSQEKIFVHQMTPKVAQKLQIKTYTTGTIQNIAKDAPENGFTILLLPALTDIHLHYAQNAPEYEDMFVKPIAGWVAGVHLDDLGNTSPRVFNGGNGKSYTEEAVVMHVTLPPNRMANIGIVNIQDQGDGDTLEFSQTGFVAENVLVNGVEQNFAKYLAENKVDTKLPLVADYAGAMLNVSFQEVNEEYGTVSFFAPVFTGIEYKLAKPVSDYVGDFLKALPEDADKVVFSCNCLLNYLYSDLEGKKLPSMTGPMTFGEIAYQLLNQTLVYLTIEEF
jgi:hypothetical protein